MANDGERERERGRERGGREGGREGARWAGRWAGREVGRPGGRESYGNSFYLFCLLVGNSKRNLFHCTSLIIESLLMIIVSTISIVTAAIGR